MACVELKVLICGDGAIGKTCLLDTLCDKAVTDWDAPVYKPTAAENLNKEWTDEDNTDYSVTFWDTAGQESLGELRRAAYLGTQILLIGFDMTKGISLENVESWVAEFNAEEKNPVAIILLGTKYDFFAELSEAGELGTDGKPLKTIEDMYEMAVKVGANAFIATSAKNGYGLLEFPDETDNFCGDADSITKQGDQWVKAKILEFAQANRTSAEIPKLNSRKAAPPAPATKPVPAKQAETVPVAPKPVPVVPVAPAKPEPVALAKPKQEDKKKTEKKDESCCTLL